MTSRLPEDAGLRHLGIGPGVRVWRPGVGGGLDREFGHSWILGGRSVRSRSIGFEGPAIVTADHGQGRHSQHQQHRALHHSPRRPKQLGSSPTGRRQAPAERALCARR
jgi:hypothetical protein